MAKQRQQMQMMNVGHMALQNAPINNSQFQAKQPVINSNIAQKNNFGMSKQQQNKSGSSQQQFQFQKQNNRKKKNYIFSVSKNNCTINCHLFLYRLYSFFYAE